MDARQLAMVGEWRKAIMSEAISAAGAALDVAIKEANRATICAFFRSPSSNEFSRTRVDWV